MRETARDGREEVREGERERGRAGCSQGGTEGQRD